MHWLQRLFRRAQPKSQPARRPRPQLHLEGLETRLAPANVFVVPIAQLADASHWHTLAQALAAAGASGTVTVEPGASVDNVEPVAVSTSGITIQGDPNTPATILPRYQLQVSASNVTLANLNLASVQIGSSGSTADFAMNTIVKCLIGTLNDYGFNSSFTQNTFTNYVKMIGSSQVDQADVVANNTFTSTAGTLLEIDYGFGTQVTGNAFFGDSTGIAIKLANCNGFPPGGTVVANNTIALIGNDVDTAVGIEIDQVGINLLSSVRVANNTITTQGLGTGIKMTMTQDGDFSAGVEGNDFHGNGIGVAITGDGTTGIGSVAQIDLGGGGLSIGGNDFRSFTSASATKGAIVLQHAPTTTVAAQMNLFSVTPATAVFTNGGAINTANSLVGDAAFVQTLYNDDLGRTGSPSELNAWVALLQSQGHAAVVNGIFRSSESLGRIVDGFYLRFLGRQSDASGRAGWISFLQHGGTEEQMESLFLTSPEYLSHIDTDFVQSLYINILGRTGATSELAGWNSNLQSLGLLGIANGFTGSTENRQNAIVADYETYLHRAPTSPELTALTNASQDQLTMAVTVQLTSEFYSNG